MAREELSDKRWEQLRPLLPPQKPRTGRPNNDHRTVLSGLLWILRTGAPWRELPPRFGSWAPVASRFYRWRKAGIGQRILERLQQQSDQAGLLDWSLHFVAGTVVRAHQHAAGARHSTPQEEALGRSRGDFRTTVHVRAERRGKPLVLVLSAGQRHEQRGFVPLREGGAVKRPGRGRPRVRPQRVRGDKGYSSRTVRRYLRRRGSGAVIPTKKDERPHVRFDRAAYRERNVVERLINRLKAFRRLATRYEKRAANYLAMCTLAAILIWL
jgi:transposase